MEYPLNKRVLDIAGATIGLALFLPFLPILALAITLESRGPIFVRLERISEGRAVRIFKLRSMVVNALEKKANLLAYNERHDGPFFKIRRDPRVTRVGRVIRRLRVDEIPQLLNVLMGELSLVGPRPHEPEEVLHYPVEFIPLTHARAGVTGLSQVNGASSLPFRRELELDTYYLTHWNVWLDMRILAKTGAIFLFDASAV